ncbi:MAG: galactokinase family protein [Spirochaetales bacterium]|uniref:Galactokinase family protein n=1 Tax=Candidatus Thalassospirochaeta sargassi TaxID=3119039 RepID=A0AAJ1IBW7_9SPIO|nr:galactokinase family protein [Spirochaetales bacterium]
MTKVSELIKKIEQGAADDSLLEIYTENHLEEKKARYVELLNRHSELFGDVEAMIISSPGRTELGGNHTDHNLGNVLAGSVDFDSVCVASLSADQKVVLDSKGYDAVRLSIDELSKRASEKDTTNALIRGILFRFDALGHKIGGFNCNMDSEVLPGSGLSSSASVEVLVGTLVSELFNEGKIGFVEVAKIGQFAENEYFGKASGLMDQVACAAGGVVGIDFRDPEKPVIKPIKYSFDEKGYELMVTDVRSSHANLSDEYSAMPEEMKSIAGYFGKSVCREITIEQLTAAASVLRERFGDRAVLRAFHFLNENERAVAELKALESDSLTEYFNLVNASGNSSFKYLQNIYLGTTPKDQSISVGLAFAEQFLSGAGACRVQGGGFAGTIQAYVPKARVKDYIVYMESIFGEGCSAELRIRNKPACRVL